MQTCRTYGLILIGVLASACAPTLVNFAPQQQVHVVQAGETLYAIAWRHRLDVRDLVRWNQLENPDLILVGQRLVLMPSDSSSPPASEPSGSESADSQPPASGPVVSQPAGSGQAGSQPTVSSPPASGPSASAPVVSRPADSVQAGSEPAVSRPPASAPSGSEPAVSRPASSGQAGSEPVVSRPPASVPSAPEPSTQAASTPPVSKPPASAQPASPPARTPPASLSASGWQWPVRGPVVSPYGASAGAETGIGIGGEIGASIRAAAPGDVVYAGDGLAAYGNLIIIKHNDTYLSAYGHNDQMVVSEGDAVDQGQEIARMGLGPERKPQLHFEIRRNGTPVDPMGYLPR